MNNYQSDSLTSLIPALLKAQIKLEVAKKDKRAGSGQAGSRTYKYADWPEIIAASRKPLADNDLCVAQRLMTKEDGSLLLSTLLLHKSGEYLESRIAIHMPAGATPQQVGSCITYYKRYSYCCLIGVVTDDEDDDGQRAVEAYKSRPQPQQPPKPQPAPVVDPSSNFISPDQFRELDRTLQGTHPSLLASILKKYTILTLEQLPRTEYEYVIDKVRERKQAEQGK